ncbi:MAG: amidohydrolase family protein [Saprospiraceae bacterium]|nr:amidohydrolase family protein [Saprospiraceae bacterium]
MKKALLLLLALSSWLTTSFAQVTFPQNGVYDEREGLYAFTNATVFTSYNQKIEGATLLIRDGKVEAVGKDVAIPKEAVQIDLKGKFIYPSFIDLYSDYGMPEMPADRPRTGGGGGGFGNQQMLTSKQGAYMWNEALKSEYNAHENFKVNDKAAKPLRDVGFGAVLAHRMDGISRGAGTLVTLTDKREHEVILREKAAHLLSFNKGTSTQSYPSSLVGGIALLRQTYHDGQWYAGQSSEVNISLKAWNDLQSLPQFFEVRNQQEAQRALRLGKEFGKTYIIKGVGDEYQRLDELKATGASFILPLNFPEAFDVEDPYDALQINLSQMKHWELAPTNPARLAAAGVNFAITTNGLKKTEDFFGQLRKAIENGLTEEQALKALTYTPAQLVGAYDRLGSLEKGKLANFIITNGSVFAKDAKIYHNWVQGKGFVIKDLDAPDWIGAYAFKVGDTDYRLLVKGKNDSPEMSIAVNDTTSIKIKHQYSNGQITMSFEPDKSKQRVRLSGVVEGRNWKGRGQDATGKWINWSATFTGPADEKKEDKKPDSAKKEQALGPVLFPFGPYGREKLPTQATYLIRNATVWTNEKDGILKNADVLIENGKISKVGPKLSAANAITIDGTGKHVTPGIIDEHSHIAISRGVNEGAQESSAEVRMGDVIDSEDISIYRQLSGGVTASQLLHGSANPIGGQSAMIKLRWGYNAEALKVQGADGFIKFALGENVKQSSSSSSTRFPQTRMGVEQVYEDYFTRAREYGKLKASGKPYRKDLDLEAILEILDKKRFITCHSYVQSEINMLMKVAERFGFRINTFTHILEGYKVADIMAKHGVGGSSFADWWAYKYEVYEAIPYNGALMHEEGVTVAFNSDDDEMARRLNQEAAKAVLFGGVSEEEALKFVTLNPAKLLHLDQRMGSLKTGKDADVVLWSDQPLSVYAKAEKTFIDGILFFDRDEDIQLRDAIAKERSRLIQKMIEAKQGGQATQPARGRMSSRHYHCDDAEDEMYGE